MMRWLLCVMSVIGSLVSGVGAQTFTYQGSLESGGAPASGPHDFEFRLLGALSGGLQIGATQSASGVAVVDGVFSVSMDFGPNAFPGADRFLEIRTRPSGVGASFSTLSPRQRVTASPYAIRSLADRWIDQGNGSLVNDTARVSSLYLNRTTPVTGADYLTVRTPTGDGQFGGMYVETASASGQPFYGYARNNFVRAYTYIDPNGNWALHMSGNRLVVTSSGQVGINMTPTGSQALQVSGDSTASGTTTAADLRYNAPRARVYTVGAVDFRPILTNVPGTFGGPGFVATLDASVAFAEIVAPLHLPAGALITGAHFYWSGGTTENIGTILRVDIDSVTERQMLSATTAGQTGAYSEATVLGLNAPIDPSSAVYWIRVRNDDWNFGTWVRFVKVFYIVPAPD